jgi:predicted DNA-binding transcriptional regulator AlpA
MSALLTPQAVSEALGGISVRTLGKWRSEGTGPTFLKVGKHVRYRERDLLAWIDGQEKNGNGAGAVVEESAS